MPNIGYADVYANASIIMLTVVGLLLIMWLGLVANVSKSGFVVFKIAWGHRIVKHAEPV